MKRIPPLLILLALSFLLAKLLAQDKSQRTARDQLSLLRQQTITLSEKPSDVLCVSENYVIFVTSTPAKMRLGTEYWEYQIYSTQAKKIVRTHRVHAPPCNCVLGPDYMLVSQPYPERLTIVAAITSIERVSFSDPQAAIEDFGYSKTELSFLRRLNANEFIVTDRGPGVYRFHPGTKKLTWQFNNPDSPFREGSPFTDVIVRPDGKAIAASNVDHCYSFDLNARKRRELDLHGATCRLIGYSADSRYLALSACYTGEPDKHELWVANSSDLAIRNRISVPRRVWHLEFIDAEQFLFPNYNDKALYYQLWRGRIGDNNAENTALRGAYLFQDLATKHLVTVHSGEETDKYVISIYSRPER